VDVNNKTNKQTISTLESLNTNILIITLYACNSFSNLAFIIYTLPTLFYAFRSIKAAVLLHVVSNILGLITRDAALLI
jgi:hypothetical protein